jgi:hypothetical protein
MRRVVFIHCIHVSAHERRPNNSYLPKHVDTMFPVRLEDDILSGNQIMLTFLVLRNLRLPAVSKLQSSALSIYKLTKP